MSFAYYQGQESEALAYFKKMLETQPDPDTRKQLQELVDKLQKIVDEQKVFPRQIGSSVENTVWQKA